MTIRLQDLIKETEVYKRFPGLFEHDELLRASRGGLIQFYNLGKGRFYTEEQIVNYIERYRVNTCTEQENKASELNVPALETALKSAANGSAKKAASGTVTGMTPQMAEAVGSRWEHEISKKPS